MFYCSKQLLYHAPVERADFKTPALVVWLVAQIIWLEA